MKGRYTVKRTLKTLLMTTLFMLPTVFGAGKLPYPTREEGLRREQNAAATIQKWRVGPISIEQARGLTVDEARVFANLMVATIAKRVPGAVQERTTADKRAAERKLAEIVGNATAIVAHMVAKDKVRYDTAREELELFLDYCAIEGILFDEVLSIAINFNPLFVHMNRREHQDFLSSWACNNFNEAQIQILKGLLPVATPHETQLAVNELRKLGPDYNKVTDKLLLRIHWHWCSLYRLGLLNKTRPS
jgi:hypothetical protein